MVFGVKHGGRGEPTSSDMYPSIQNRFSSHMCRKDGLRTKKVAGKG